MRGRAYLRVSTDEQAEDGYSLQAQERACRLYAEMKSFDLVEIYIDDGYSGKNANRPGLRRLLDQVEPGEIVLVHKLDRLARNTALLLSTIEQFKSQNIRLISIEEEIDLLSPIGIVLVTLLGSFAQYYVDNLAAETAKGHREKARQGLWVGPVPFGYRKIDRGHIEPSEDAPTVQLIYRLYIEGQSFNAIVAALNGAGLQSYNWKTGKRQAFTRETVRTILRNRAYAGFVSSGGTEFPGEHTPLVSLETWEQAAAIRAGRTVEPGAGGPRHRGKIAPGRLYCAKCGGRLHFRYSGRYGDSRGYVCAGRGRGCTAGQSRADLVEHQVAEMVALAGYGLDQVEQVFNAIWVESGEVVAVDLVERYRQLGALAGWTIRQQLGGDGE